METQSERLRIETRVDPQPIEGFENLLDPEGRLVVNAPHMPVHLGAMAETVKRVLLDNPDLAPGDVVPVDLDHPPAVRMPVGDDVDRSSGTRPRRRAGHHGVHGKLLHGAPTAARRELGKELGETLVTSRLCRRP